jgi:hypothetical protein
MGAHYRRIGEFLRRVLAGRGIEELARLKPRHDPPSPRVPGGSALTKDVLALRWIKLGIPGPDGHTIRPNVLA